MSNRPNILFLFTDQQRRDSLGCYGNRVCRTPNVDALADEGVRFDHAYTPTAICTPARASLLTGVMPHKHKLLANFERNVGYNTELGDDAIPFSRYLRDAGYEVETEGKWHIGVVRGPEYYGFKGSHFPGWADPIDHEEYVAYLDQRGLPRFRVRDEVRGVFPNGQPSNVIAGVYDGPPEGTFTYFLAERTIERLRRHAESGNKRPFFLACQWFGPHLPYFLPKEYLDMYDPNDVELPVSMGETFENKPRVQRHYSAHWAFDSFAPDQWRKIIAMYWGYVTFIDEQVGRILKALQELGLAENTAVFFSSDHGAFVGSHRMQDKGPAMYDDIYRIPLVAKMPGGARGIVDDHFVSLIDLTATFVDLAGVEVPEHFDGRSLLPLLRGEKVDDWRNYIVAEFHGHHFPYPQRMIRTDRYKLIVNPPDVNELYDLQNDPHELVNQIDNPEYRSVRDNLYALLYRELKSAGDNFYHWMSSMFPVGEDVGDASLSPFSSK